MTPTRHLKQEVLALETDLVVLPSQGRMRDRCWTLQKYDGSLGYKASCMWCVSLQGLDQFKPNVNLSSFPVRTILGLLILGLLILGLLILGLLILGLATVILRFYLLRLCWFLRVPAGS